VEYYVDDVTVKCVVCNKTNRTIMRYGLYVKFPDDYDINCPTCDNSESGNGHLQSFILIEDHEHREMTQEEFNYYGLDYD
jgi:hypothetical protein